MRSYAYKNVHKRKEILSLLNKSLYISIIIMLHTKCVCMCAHARIKHTHTRTQTQLLVIYDQFI